ncbi:Uncharacterised protein [Mycobacterium tuberculosis]|uniref:Uncharacterized protein n=1 Tax=Mycobacterium tuberculosis TaxID=1773 RepID=A0A654U6K9_MYCTX|nr:Uncharacterised protein [Mycobacterium tuberculosis]COW66349.1 Uncharacterised protein [Mycobacterium tuberculosis]
MKQHADFTEVVPRRGGFDQFLTAVGQFAHNLELALGHHVDQIAHCGLLEQHLAGFHVHRFGWLIRRHLRRHQLKDAIGQRQHPAVVGRDHHHTVALR